jgi:hypothetical protein
MGNDKNEIAVVSQSPAAMIMSLMEKSKYIDFEKIEKFLDIQKKWEENNARKAYHLAMSEFKANPPDIEKDKKVKYKTNAGETAYNHASLGNVTEKINSALSKYELSAGWLTKQEGSNVTVTCRISHSLGHSEETSLTAAPDASGGKNTIQALGSTISYLQRYTLLALTGLATHDMDDDGKASEEINFITDKQKSSIVDMFNSLELSEGQKANFFKLVNVEKDDFDKILASDFGKAMNALKATATAKGKK